MDTNAIAEKYANKYIDEMYATPQDLAHFISEAIAEATQGMWTKKDLKKAFFGGQETATTGLYFDEWLAEYKALKSKNE